jgi:DMSO/TMAO reductase YedYZ molybdopterin-dependent catalytic subunit
MGLFDKKVSPDGVNAYGKPRLPQGQTGTEKFPVLTYGPTQYVDTKEWSLKVWGLAKDHVWSWDEFMALPQKKLTADFHCVTHWSRFNDEWEGVFFRDLIQGLSIHQDAKHVLQHAYGGYTTNLPLDWMIEEDVMFVHTINGEPLTAEHGGPLRVLTPKRYAWKGAKWVNGLEFLAKDKPGFWEQNGYSNTADPWKEERFR